MSLEQITPLHHGCMRPKFLSSLQQICRPRKSVRHLILKQRWESLRRYISTVEGKSEVELVGCDDDQTALHLACGFDPPVDVVRTLLEICPHAISKVNLSGRTPLHVAAPAFESAELIGLLVERFPAAASVVDKGGKTPLILLCEHARFDVDDQPLILAGFDKAWKEMLDAVVALCLAAPPCMVTVEDSTGKTALEYAIINNADMELVKYLMIRTVQAVAAENEMSEKVHVLMMKSKNFIAKVKELNNREQKVFGFPCEEKGLAASRKPKVLATIREEMALTTIDEDEDDSKTSFPSAA